MIFFLSVLMAAALEAAAAAASSSSSGSEASFSTSDVDRDFLEALTQHLRVTTDLLFPTRVKPSASNVVKTLCFTVENVGHKSWHEPQLELQIGSPVGDAWVNLQANVDQAGSNVGNGGNKGADQRGNGVTGRVKRGGGTQGLDPEAAKINGPVGDDLLTVLLDPFVNAGQRVHVGKAARFCFNGTLPVAPHTEALLAVRAMPLHRGAKTLDTNVFFVDVSCSDGLFCNGAERWVDGACRPAPRPACDDANACTIDSCSEKTGTCHWQLDAKRADCLECAGDQCVPDCTGKKCGSDGCDGSCGGCADGQACADGACASIAGLSGTCASPLRLLPPTFAPVQLSADKPFEFTVTGSTNDAVNDIFPSCNQASDAREQVFVFEVPDGAEWGMMASVTGTRLDGEQYDTVLDLRKTDCRDYTAAVTCADDSTPPGGLSSAISATLDAGTYFLIVDGYDAQEIGDFSLVVRLYAGCTPTCDGSLCGTEDGCGGACGGCATGERCTNVHRCVADTCVADCAGKHCGDDGCLGKCDYECVLGESCIFETGQCVIPNRDTGCDRLQPVCATPCGAGAYCNSNCECTSFADEALPDMVVGSKDLANDIVISKRFFPPTACAVEEACVAGIGMRRLLRFTFSTVNQGNAAFVGGDPKLSPTVYFFSPCHAHFHFSGLATYELLDTYNRSIVLGRKAGYCLLDAKPKVKAPWVPCQPQFECDDQGISAGWADVYGNSLDCQWLDITGVPAGTYRLRVGINPYRTFAEKSFANNVVVHTFQIPPDDDFEYDALGPEQLANRFAVERKAQAIANEAVNRAGMNRVSAVHEAVTLLKMWYGDLERACASQVPDSSSSASSSSLTEHTDELCVKIVRDVFDKARIAIMERRRK